MLKKLIPELVIVIIVLGVVGFVIFKAFMIFGVDAETAKQYPEYTTLVRYEFNSAIYSYYVKPDSGWGIEDGVLTLTDYVYFDSNKAYNQRGQNITLSGGIGWYMKEKVRDEVK